MHLWVNFIPESEKNDFVEECLNKLESRKLLENWRVFGDIM